MSLVKIIGHIKGISISALVRWPLAISFLALIFVIIEISLQDAYDAPFYEVAKSIRDQEGQNCSFMNNKESFKYRSKWNVMILTAYAAAIPIGLLLRSVIMTLLIGVTALITVPIYQDFVLCVNQ